MTKNYKKSEQLVVNLFYCGSGGDSKSPVMGSPLLKGSLLAHRVYTNPLHLFMTSGKGIELTVIFWTFVKAQTFYWIFTKILIAPGTFVEKIMSFLEPIAPFSMIWLALFNPICTQGSLIHKAYHKTSFKVHPDTCRVENKDIATEKFQALGAVYNILKYPG